MKKDIDEDSAGSTGDEGVEGNGSTAPAPGVPAAAAFPIVGVGASAGGLEAFTQLLEQLPADTGMAFVLIQHLDPDARELPARGAGQGHGDAGQPGRGRHARRAEPRLRHPAQRRHRDPARAADAGAASARRAGRPHLPIDFFFRSLAAERGSHAIGVVLSGTASDGTEGLRAIKAEDGITFAQDPGVGEVRRHAAQRGRRRRRRLLPADPRRSPASSCA